MLEPNDSICHINLYFYYCERMIGCGVREATLSWYSSRVFLEFYYLRVNINILLYNPNLIYNKFSFSFRFLSFSPFNVKQERNSINQYEWRLSEHGT